MRFFGNMNERSRESRGEGWILSITLQLGAGDIYVMGVDWGSSCNRGGGTKETMDGSVSVSDGIVPMIGTIFIYSWV